MLVLSSSTADRGRKVLISGQSIAKSARHRTPRQRAMDAADWYLCRKWVLPSTKLAADTFQVCEKLVREEISKKLQANSTTPVPVKPIDMVFDSLDGREIEAFVGRHAEVIWRALDHITA